METEGKLLHNEESFHKHKSPEEHASSLPPHLKDPERSWRRCHSGLRSKQSYDNQEEKPGEGQRNSGRFGRGFANESSYDGRRRERQLYDPREKASKSNSQVFPQGKINGRNSADGHVKGDRGPRSTPNSARRPRPDHTSMSHFEVKMADFPELGGLPAARPDVLLVQKDSWRNTPSPVSPRIPRSPWKPSKEDPPSSDPRVTPTENNSDSPDIAPAGTSWANVASQPPKKPSRETTTRDNQQEDHNSLQEEGNMGKKKRRRKKKKPKDSNEDAEDEDEECLTHQEPPKFEDEEEFPGLTASGFCEVTSSSYASKLGKKENPKDQHLSTDQLKEKSSLKSQQEMIKKPQVAQKTSGKKSKAPVQLDFGNMLAVLEETQKSQKTKQDVKSVISVGGGLPFIPKQPPVQKKAPWQQEKIAHNPLDSTSPLVKKGKQREVPKAKKPTPLKKIILKEREERKQRRLLEEQGLLPETEAVQATDAAEEEQIAANSADEETDTVIQEEEEESHVDEAHKDNTESHKEEVVEQQPTQTVTDSIPKPKIHSRKFRDYCSQMLSKEVDECVTTLLKELVRFQDRLHQKDPMKARMKRRIVMGLREVLKHLKLRKVKCVVISPNCERVQSKGGLDEALHTIINTCREQEVPFVFALSRKALGRCLNKVVPVSLVGIFNYDGAQDHYHKMIELSSEARKAYEVMVCSLEQAEHEEGEDWPVANIDEGQDIDTQSCTGGSDPSPAPPDEPEYIKLWKTLLKDCNHKVLDFQSKLVNPESHVVDGEVEPS